MSHSARVLAQPSTLPGSPDGDPGSLDELVGASRRIARRWAAPRPAEPARVSPGGIHGTTVPAASAHVVDGMSDYGS